MMFAFLSKHAIRLCGNRGKDAILDAVNLGSKKTRGSLWYSVGRYLYVPFAMILCVIALWKQIAF